MPSSILFIIVICLALLFTYSNGFQDGSSVAATAIGCRAMSPMQAVLLCAVFEFLGALFGGSAVSRTISGMTNCPAAHSLLAILASALLAAIFWNFMTKMFGMPSSSTHALVGGFAGALIYAGGLKYVVIGNIFHPSGVLKAVISLFASVLLGFSAGFIFLLAIMWLLSGASTRVNKLLKAAQWLITPALAFAHGANDTQKSMGILMLALVGADAAGSHGIPLWMRVLFGSAISLGVISLAPGIVKRVGSEIYRLRPVHGFTTQLASAAVVLGGSITGSPVSATQVIASTVMGIGTAERRKGVHWLIARDMILSWLFTIPCTFVLGGLIYVIFHNLCRTKF